MVSAELLAQLERRCREIMRDLSGAFDGHVRPFGGLNVILAGDLYQLTPPRGTFIGDVPWPLLTGKQGRTTPLAAQGQALLWGRKQEAMQGVTELTRCERTGDAWLASVQDELREGRLSADNHAFLHGKPTSVPGSWCQQEVACRNPMCEQLLRRKEKPEYIAQNECEQCKKERGSRKLVATDAADARFHGAFRDATANFSTNDIKSRQQTSCYGLGRSVHEANTFCGGTRRRVRHGATGETAGAAGKNRVAAATRSRMRWIVWGLTYMRWLAYPCDGAS